MSLYIGIDVGTSSVRALAIRDGQTVASSTHPLDIRQRDNTFFEQSSEQVWHAVCKCVRELHIDHARVKGIGFAATCSLVLLDKNG